MDLTSLLVVWGLAAAVSLAVTGFVAAAGLGDAPGPRSSHSRTTPTAGGLGALAGLSCGLLFAAPEAGPSLAILLALVFALTLAGLQDDVYGMRTSTKFAVILAVGLLAVQVLGPVSELPLHGDASLSLPLWLGWTGTVLWIFVVVNAVNFCDGLNGYVPGILNAVFVVLAGLCAAIGSTDAMWLALAASGGLVGFLPYNFRDRARVFLGDVGSLPMGFLLAVLPLLAVGRGGSRSLLYIVPLLLLPILADVLLTLVRKLRRRDPFLAAHRDHLYQRLSRRWGSHVLVSGVGVSLVLPLTALAVLALGTGWHRSLPALLGVAAILAGLHLWLSRRLDAYEVRATT